MLGGRSSERVLGYRQFQVLAFIRAHLAEHGYAPTLDEVCDETGVGTRGEACRIVKALEKRALIRRVGRYKVRSIQLYGE